jgi:Ca2+-binding EF-hand superfamily protein
MTMQKIKTSSCFQCLIKAIWSIFVLSVLSCSASKSNVADKSWDRDTDGSIDRREFVEGYLANDYYKFWGSSFGVNSSTFFERLFLRMDLNQDGFLDSQEFNTQIKTYSFGLMSARASEWDNDNNAVLARHEFVEGAAKSKLFSLWDTSADKSISSREMAGGMFYVCDKDNDHGVNSDELEVWEKNIPK